MPRYWIDVFRDDTDYGYCYTVQVWDTDTGMVVWEKDYSPSWRDESEVRKAAADEVRRLLAETK